MRLPLSVVNVRDALNNPSEVSRISSRVTSVLAWEKSLGCRPSRPDATGRYVISQHA